MTSYQESDSASRPDDGDTGGCLVPLIGATISLAIAITLISWLWLDTEESDDITLTDAGTSAGAATPAEDASSSGSTLADLLSEFDADQPGGVSTEAIVVVIQSGGWQEYGQPEVYDLGSQQRVARTFRRDGQRLRATIHTYKSDAAASAVLERVELPSRAVQFGNKAIVLEPVSEGALAGVSSLAERLRRFRDLLAEQDGPDGAGDAGDAGGG